MNKTAELTIKSVLLGIVLAMVMAGANAYLGLFAGMTVSASIPAAVVSMGILSLFRKHSIFENNIVQTAASAGESLAAGVIFTLPALILMGHWDTFDFWQVTAIAGLGGVIGVLFTVPLRRSLIVDKPLKFPEGVATAEVLKAGTQTDSKDGIKLLAIAGLTGAMFKFAESGLKLWTATLEGAKAIGGSVAYFGTNLSPMLIGVGYIVRLNIATLVFVGGAISWWIAIPIYYKFFAPTDPAIAEMFLQNEKPADIAWQIWTSKIRYLGVGAMVVGGVWALISMGSSIVDGIRSGLEQIRNKIQTDEKYGDDMPMNWVVGILVFSIVPIFLIYQSVVGDFAISLSMAIVMLIAGFLFSAVAAYMAGLVGSSNNPISGVTIATVLFASLLLLFLTGPENQIGPAAAILIGAVVCSAAAIGGDNMQDLKAGHIIGATPKKQQIMQIVGTVSAAFVMAPVLNLLLKAYGFGPKSVEFPNSLKAPQATLMQSVADGVFGGNLPWGMIGIGAIIGIAIIIFDQILHNRNAKWRTPVLAVAVGIYLPLELSVPIFVGGLIAHFSEKYFAKQGKPENSGEKRGLLFASGLITGEAIVGILLAIPIVLTKGENIFQIANLKITYLIDNIKHTLSFPNEMFGGFPGLVGVIMVSIWFYKTIKKKGK